MDHITERENFLDGSPMEYLSQLGGYAGDETDGDDADDGLSSNFTEEWQILLEWDDSPGRVYADADEWDEPEPLAEYNSELRRPRYEIEDDDIALTVKLRIDRLIAQLDVASPIQRITIAELLAALGHSRLRLWLPWLIKQQWTGDSLLLFLRFRAYWDLCPHWWEYTFWDWRARCWYPTHSRYSLTLGDTYDLIHRRLDCHPGKVIDESWLADWLELALWQCGFYSFASFAVFRAGFAPSENWTRHLDWNDLDDSDRHKGYSDTRNNDYWPYHYGLPPWLAEQDWWDASEWHDNLGW